MRLNFVEYEKQGLAVSEILTLNRHHAASRLYLVSEGV